ncbi:MAG: hypothetical protein ACJ73D_12015 [Pyrinomonadaceae bacterium]
MRTRRKPVLRQIIIFIAVALLLVQIPFAYRAYQLSSVAKKIASTNPQPPITMRADGLHEYVGVMHVHTVHSGEISDEYDEMLAAACDNQLDFVVLTEHYSAAFDTSTATLNGWYGSTLFVAGNEVNSRPGDRFLMLPGGKEASDYRLMPTNDVVDHIHATNGLAIAAYPEKFDAWNTPFDGIEVANLNTMLRGVDKPAAVLDYLWSGHVDRPLAIARYFKRQNENLKQFDSIAANRHIVLTAGIDAHSAIGFHLLGDELGDHLVGFKLDPYTYIFRLARLHLLSDTALDRESLLAAIKSGSFFVAFDVLADSRGFSFAAQSGGQTVQMGTEVPFAQGMKLHASSPVAARIVILRNGETVAQNGNTVTLSTDVTAPGEYRVEVYREGLGADFDNIPWILSNPIFVR